MNIIETNRLSLHQLSTNDAPFILALWNDPAWMQFISDKGSNKTIANAISYIENIQKSYQKLGFGLFLTKLKKSQISIGICGLLKRDYLEDVDIGFAFLPQFRGKGYAIEAASAVIDYAEQSLALNRIVAITQPDNVKSIKVLNKLGLKFEKMVCFSGEEINLELYAKNKT